MSDELVDKKITQSEADVMMAPMELDLFSIFKVIEEEILTEIEDFEGTPEEFIDDIDNSLELEKSINESVVNKDKTNKRDYKKEYDDFHGNPEQVKNRTKRNKARRESKLKPGDSKEIDHIKPLSSGGSNKKENTRIVSRKTNRKKGAKIKKEDNGVDRKTIMIGLIKQVLDNFKRRY